MQDSGLTQSRQPSVITTPISKLQTSISTHYSGKNLADASNDGLAGSPMVEPLTVEEYVATRNEPYSLHYLGLPQELRSVSNYKKYGEFIDSFISNEVAENQLEDGVDTYTNIINDLISSIGLSGNTKANVKLDKLYRWIKYVITPQRKIENRKRKILNGQLS